MNDDALEEITLAELLDMAWENRAIDLHVAIPVQVTAYNKDAGTVDVVPQLNRAVPDGDGNYVSDTLPKLANVPIEWPRVAQFAITFPIAVGDYGKITCCERNIGAWRKLGTQCDPGDLGMHTLSGAVYKPGLNPDSMPPKNADAANMILGSEMDGASRIEIKPSGGINLGAGASKGVKRTGDTVDIGTWSVAVDPNTHIVTVTYAIAVPAGGPAGAPLFTLKFQDAGGSAGTPSINVKGIDLAGSTTINAGD